MRRSDGPIGVDRSKLDCAVLAGRDLHVRPQADRGVQRRRAVVKEVERPDVDGAAGQIDAGGSGRSQAHAVIIAISARTPNAERRTTNAER